jgi:hypothetical protein
MPQGIAEIDRRAVDDRRGGMERLGEGDVEAAVGDGAARIAGIDVLHALAVQIHCQLEHRDHHRARALGDLDRVSDMIVMAMGEDDVGAALPWQCSMLP